MTIAHIVIILVDTWIPHYVLDEQYLVWYTYRGLRHIGKSDRNGVEIQMYATDLAITCQHGQPLHIELEFGVTTYHHPDNTLCPVFNSLGMTFDTAMSTNYQHLLLTKDLNFETVAIHLTSRKARQYFYEYLSTCDGNALLIALETYIAVIAKSPLASVMMQELFTIFGKKMRYNVSSIDNNYLSIEENMKECTRLGCATVANGSDKYATELDADITMRKNTTYNGRSFKK